LIQSRKGLRSTHSDDQSGSHDLRQSLLFAGLACAFVAIVGFGGCNQGATSQDVMAKVNGSKILYGTFLTALIAFILIAAGVYFFFVLPYNRMQARMKARAAKPEESTTRACPECLSMIPKAATRCSFCTTVVAPQATA